MPSDRRFTLYGFMDDIVPIIIRMAKLAFCILVKDAVLL